MVSVQSRATDPKISVPEAPVFAPDDILGRGLIIRVGEVAERFPEWSIYPALRDRMLRRFWKTEPIVAGAIYSLSARMKSLPFHLHGDDAMRDMAQAALDNSEFGAGLRLLISRTVTDLLTQDNGAFWELVGAGNVDGPLVGPVQAVNHLDSAQCYRTYDPLYPVLYVNPITNARHRLHYSRVHMMSSMPQPNELARGIGVSPLSRALQYVQLAKAQLTYRYEKSSGQFNRGIIHGQGTTARSIEAALKQAENATDAIDMTYYKGLPILVSQQGIDLNLLDLASLPDNFDVDSETTLYVYILALAFGVDAREFWPATQSGATKADASVQNMKARGKGIADLITTIEDGLLQRVLPAGVEGHFDFIDDEHDAAVAQIQNTRTQVLDTYVRNGALTPQQMLAIAVAEGIIDDKVLEEVGMDPDNVNDDAETDEGLAGMKTQAGYLASIRTAIRGLYQGAFSFFDFVESMDASIRRGLTQAWLDAIRPLGLTLDDLTDIERARLEDVIREQMQYVIPLGEDILTGVANNVPQSTYLQRAQLWANRYVSVTTLARSLAAADMPMRWEYGDTIDHCPDCERYEGRVYRASVWRKFLEPHDAMPGGKGLACEGWQCDCRLELAEGETITRGFPPRPRGRKTGEHAHAH